MNNFTFRHTSWFDKEYAVKLDLDGYKASRAATMKAALCLFIYRQGKTIVETGCQRGLEDWGAGCSTQILSLFAKKENCLFYSVDIDSDKLEFARVNFENDNSKFYCMDSLDFFKDGIVDSIDLLYLDSYDYPIVEICDLYGPREDYKKNYAILDNLTEEKFVERHGDMISASQEHCRKELLAALPFLHNNSIILIDDSGLPGGGKARLARQVLIDKGWICLLDAYQTLWVQEKKRKLK